MNNKNGMIVRVIAIAGSFLLAGCVPVMKKTKEKGVDQKYETRSVNGRIMARRLEKRIEDELIPRPLDNGYSADQVYAIVHNEIGVKSFNEMKDVLLEAHCLKMAALVNALARSLVVSYPKLAHHIVQEKSYTIIPADLHIYLKKHLRLKEVGVQTERSIADVIAQQEEFLVHDDRGCSLKLEGKHITSLYGIKQLHGLKYWGQVIDVATIEHLYLRSNYLLDHEHDPEFPAKPFEQFTQLQTLCLDENLLTVLPSTMFTGLENLSHLYLNDNKLVQLPEDLFQGLSQLDHLEISNNKLESLPATLFQGLNNLLWVGLNYNNLTSLPEDIFKGLNKLFLLEIAHNRLATLPPHIFQGLIKLEVLDLGHNCLSNLPETIFQSLPQLKNLDLIANQLTRLPETIFQVVNKYGNLRLGGNLLSEEQKNEICDMCSDKECEVSLS